MSIYDYIKKKEGFRSKQYLDDAGVPTIGYGRTTGSFEDTTEEVEDAWLKQRIDSDRAYVKAYADKHGYKWNDRQLDALTSFVYNLGRGKLKRLTQGGKRDNKTIGNKIREYNKAGGKRLPGLVTRRNEESDMFFSTPAVDAPLARKSSFGEAFAKARKEHGADGTFTWNGKEYHTKYAEEMNEGGYVMPFKSDKQRRWMYANEPEMAEKWSQYNMGTYDVPPMHYADGSPFATAFTNPALYPEARFKGPVAGVEVDPVTGVPFTDQFAGQVYPQHMPDNVGPRPLWVGRNVWNRKNKNFYDPNTGELYTEEGFAKHHGFPMEEEKNKAALENAIKQDALRKLKLIVADIPPDHPTSVLIRDALTNPGLSGRELQQLHKQAVTSLSDAPYVQRFKDETAVFQAPLAQDSNNIRKSQIAGLSNVVDTAAALQDQGVDSRVVDSITNKALDGTYSNDQALRALNATALQAQGPLQGGGNFVDTAALDPRNTGDANTYGVIPTTQEEAEATRKAKFENNPWLHIPRKVPDSLENAVLNAQNKGFTKAASINDALKAISHAMNNGLDPKIGVNLNHRLTSREITPEQALTELEKVQNAFNTPFATVPAITANSPEAAVVAAQPAGVDNNKPVTPINTPGDDVDIPKHTDEDNKKAFYEAPDEVKKNVLGFLGKLLGINNKDQLVSLAGQYLLARGLGMTHRQAGIQVYNSVQAQRQANEELIDTATQNRAAYNDDAWKAFEEAYEAGDYDLAKKILRDPKSLAGQAAINQRITAAGGDPKKLEEYFTFNDGIPHKFRGVLLPYTGEVYDPSTGAVFSGNNVKKYSTDIHDPAELRSTIASQIGKDGSSITFPTGGTNEKTGRPNTKTVKVDPRNAVTAVAAAYTSLYGPHGYLLLDSAAGTTLVQDIIKDGLKHKKATGDDPNWHVLARKKLVNLYGETGGTYTDSKGETKEVNGKVYTTLGETYQKFNAEIPDPNHKYRTPGELWASLDNQYAITADTNAPDGYSAQDVADFNENKNEVLKVKYLITNDKKYKKPEGWSDRFWFYQVYMAAALNGDI